MWSSMILYWGIGVFLWWICYNVLKFADVQSFGRIREVLKAKNLSIGPASLVWSKNVTNGFQWRWQSIRSSLLKTLTRFLGSVTYWAGMIVMGFAQFASFFLLTLNIVLALTLSSEEERPMTLLIPGVNMPRTHLAYLVLAIFLCAVAHERGHMQAAFVAKVKIKSFGLFVRFLLPGAYVELDENSMRRSGLLNQARVYTGGSFANLVTGLLGLLLVTVIVPGFMLKPFYHVGQGVCITSVHEYDSVSRLAPEMEAGSVITRVNDCDVADLESLSRCLRIMMNDPEELDSDGHVFGQNGICFPGSGIASMIVSERLANRNEQIVVTWDAEQKEHFSHVSIDRLISVFRLGEQDFCIPGSCARGFYCVRPADPRIKLAAIQLKPLQYLDRARNTAISDDTVLFVGDMGSFYQSVDVSGWVPRFLRSISVVRIFPVVLTRFLWYFTSLSLSLVVVNIAPIFFFDGRKAVFAFVLLALTQDNLFIARRYRSAQMEALLKANKRDSRRFKLPGPGPSDVKLQRDDTKLVVKFNDQGADYGDVVDEDVSQNFRPGRPSMEMSESSVTSQVSDVVKSEPSGSPPPTPHPIIPRFSENISPALREDILEDIQRERAMRQARAAEKQRLMSNPLPGLHRRTGSIKRKRDFEESEPLTDEVLDRELGAKMVADDEMISSSEEDDSDLKIAHLYAKIARLEAERKNRQLIRERQMEDEPTEEVDIPPVDINMDSIKAYRTAGVITDTLCVIGTCLLVGNIFASMPH